MSLPGHRRTSSHKRRRASHFALSKPAIATDSVGVVHLMHRAAPNAIEYDGVAIHVKGRERKLEKMLAKTRAETTDTEAHDHDHADHGHANA